MSVHHLCAQGAAPHPQNWYGLPYECWTLDLGPLKEPTVLLTDEPSLQPQKVSFEICLKTSMCHDLRA